MIQSLYSFLPNWQTTAVLSFAGMNLTTTLYNKSLGILEEASKKKSDNIRHIYTLYKAEIRTHYVTHFHFALATFALASIRGIHRHFYPQSNSLPYPLIGVHLLIGVASSITYLAKSVDALRAILKTREESNASSEFGKELQELNKTVIQQFAGRVLPITQNMNRVSQIINKLLSLRTFYSTT